MFAAGQRCNFKYDISFNGSSYDIKLTAMQSNGSKILPGHSPHVEGEGD